MPPAGTRHELLGGENGNPAQHCEDNEFEKFKVSMVHMCHELPQRDRNEQSQYGLKFERNPTQQEIRNTILEIKKVWKIHGNKPALKNKKGTSRHTSLDVPKLSAALLSSDADQWIKAINAEYTQMGVENVYEAVATVPHGKPWVPSHMILVKQRYADGSIKKYKARLVAGGHRQDANSYNDISSPTARPATVKIIFAKAAIEKRILRTFDVKGAYLKSNIDEEIYMLLPIQKKGDKPQWVKLIKSIYGLKQAGKLWYENIRAKLLEFGAIQCPHDECLFRYTDGIEIIDIVIYVDDLLTASTTNEVGDKLINFLRNKYGEVSEITNTATHLGIRWVYNNGNIKINQPGYIDKILRELDMTNCKPEKSPISAKYINIINNKINSNNENSNINILKIDTKFQDIQQELRKILGFLNHISIHTRPDILFPVTQLATQITNCEQYHIDAAKHIVKYLAGTRELGLTFSHKGNLELIGYADASYLTHQDAKSHSGLAYSLGEESTACFFSKSSKQKLVTRSSAEAELYALDQCVCDIEWFRTILKFLGSEQLNPTTIFEDNQSAMALAEGNTKVRNCSKHLNMRYFYCKQAIKNKEVTLKYINTKFQVADILTKYIINFKEFLRLRSLLMNCAETQSG